MLGLEKDPKLAKIRAQNPLNNIAVPTDGIRDLDERIDQFYVPMESSGDGIHPFLTVHKGLGPDNTFNLTKLVKDKHSSEGSQRSSRSRAGSVHSKGSAAGDDSFVEESSFED